MQLILMLRKGEIENLRREVPFVLAPAVVLDGMKKPALRYIADYVYLKRIYQPKADGATYSTFKTQQIVEDVKSPATRKNAVYRIKKHLMKSVHGIDILES